MTQRTRALTKESPFSQRTTLIYTSFGISKSPPVDPIDFQR
jgi:hypothetical protein